MRVDEIRKIKSGASDFDSNPVDHATDLLDRASLSQCQALQHSRSSIVHSTVTACKRSQRRPLSLSPRVSARHHGAHGTLQPVPFESSRL